MVCSSSSAYALLAIPKAKQDGLSDASTLGKDLTVSAIRFTHHISVNVQIARKYVIIESLGTLLVRNFYKQSHLPDVHFSSCTY
jgi:hypothetical protein